MIVISARFSELRAEYKRADRAALPSRTGARNRGKKAARSKGALFPAPWAGTRVLIEAVEVVNEAVEA